MTTTPVTYHTLDLLAIPPSARNGIKSPLDDLMPFGKTERPLYGAWQLDQAAKRSRLPSDVRAPRCPAPPPFQLPVEGERLPKIQEALFRGMNMARVSFKGFLSFLGRY
jgi:hypothetical protein